MLSRRTLLSAGATMPLMSARLNAESPDSLQNHAARHGRVYGVAVGSPMLANDTNYAAIVASQAGMLVAEYEMKRVHVEPSPGYFDFRAGDAILAFATRNFQELRGHTLIWHEANPPWLESKLADTKDQKLITEYISTVMGKYRNRIKSWDVVNEAVEPKDGEGDGLRSSSPWFQAFGSDYIEIAFQAARQADPDALLFYNETNIEGDDGTFEKRRSATLKLLEKMVSKKIPVGAFGIQSHLKLYRATYSERTISRFLDEVGAFGLPILITELDVADIKGPRDPAKRDADVASITRMYLDVAFSKKTVLGCVTWGITDRYSWLSSNSSYKWPDGQFSRGLPYTGDYKKKPMWSAIASSFDRISG